MVAAVLFVVVALLLSQKAAPAFDWVIDQLKAPGAKLIGSYLLLAVSCLSLLPLVWRLHSGPSPLV